MNDTEVSDEVAAQRAATLERMGASGSAPAGGGLVSGQVDYFGVDETYRFVLPDGVSHFEHKKLNDGERLKYLDSTNRGVKVQQRTGEAEVPMKPGTDQRVLIKIALVGWNLMRGGQPVPFPTNERAAAPGGEIDKVLDKLPGDLVVKLADDIRDRNAWLNSNMTVEDIDEEVEQLQRTRQRLLDDQGKGSDSPTS